MTTATYRIAKANVMLDRARQAHENLTHPSATTRRLARNAFDRAAAAAICQARGTEAESTVREQVATLLDTIPANA